jgi:hypothetical protein
MADQDIDELWRSIPAHPDYEVSSAGRIRRITAGSNSTFIGKIRKLNPTWMGYLQITLRFSGEPKRFKTHYVHRLVANAFLDTPASRSEINHVNGDKTDNRASNLEWCSRSENHLHAYRTGLQTARYAHRGTDTWNSVLDEHTVRRIRVMNAIGKSGWRIGKELGLNPSTVYAVLSGYSWKHVT